VADAAVRPGAPELEIAERRSRLEHAAQLAPAGLARAGDGIDVGRPVHHLREAVLRVGLPEEVRGHLHQAAEAQLALALRFLRLLALEELADLAADDARGLHQALVGLAHRLARERENADDTALGDDRERKAAAQAAAFPQRLVLHARVVHGVLRPDRLAALPDVTRQAFARAQGDRPRTLDELPHHRVGHAPRVLKAQQAACLVQPEVAAAGPALDLAHGAAHRAHDFVRLVLSVQRRLLPALEAEVGARIQTGPFVDVARHEGEPELGVLLPVPVRGKLGQAAEARSAAGSFGPATRDCFPCVGCAPVASCHRSPLPRKGIYWSTIPPSSPVRDPMSKKVCARGLSPGAFAGEEIETARPYSAGGAHNGA